MVPSHVLCPLDGSKPATRALPSAADAALSLDVPLVLFSAVEDQHEVARRRDYLEALPGPRPDLVARAEVCVDPHAPQAIIDRAGATGLVVMATSTWPLIHSGYLGSAAETVVRGTTGPVLLVGPRATERLGSTKRVVVASDGSLPAERALVHGSEFATMLGVDLWVVTVLDPAEPPIAGIDQAEIEHHHVERLASGVGGQWEVLHGPDPATSITEWSSGDLISMATHGRSGFKRLTFGSIATSTVRWSTGPVLITCAGPGT